MRRTSGERLAEKQRKQEQRRALLQRFENEITFEAGKEVRRHKKAPLYAVLSLPIEVQEKILPLLDTLCSKEMRPALRDRLLQVFTELAASERLLKQYEGIGSGKCAGDSLSWHDAPGGTNQEAAE